MSVTAVAAGGMRRHVGLAHHPHKKRQTSFSRLPWIPPVFPAKGGREAFERMMAV